MGGKEKWEETEKAVDTEIIKIKKTKLKREGECEITEKVAGIRRR